MQTIEMNKRAMHLLEEWDPFQAGKKSYETEIADVVAELHRLDHPTDLAKRIREIYEHSFKIWIPLENCMQISYRLIAIKYEVNCIM